MITQEGGGPATRFQQAIEGRSGQALIDLISRLINDPATLERFDKELGKYPGLLFIDDYVWRNGLAWGFNQQTVERASANSWYFDSVVRSQYGVPTNFTRYV